MGPRREGVARPEESQTRVSLVMGGPDGRDRAEAEDDFSIWEGVTDQQ